MIKPIVVSSPTVRVNVVLRAQVTSAPNVGVRSSVKAMVVSSVSQPSRTA